MKKENNFFIFLRTLVRQGELRPAYARQIYLRHMESSGKEIPFGHALWLNRGWEYDMVIFGSKKAAEDNTYCPVSELPSIPGYDRRAGKSKIFGTKKGGEKMKRMTIKYLPEHCPARDGLRCEAHPEVPEMLCHIDIDPARPCEFIRVEIKGKEEE